MLVQILPLLIELEWVKNIFLIYIPVTLNLKGTNKNITLKGVG